LRPGGRRVGSGSCNLRCEQKALRVQNDMTQIYSFRN
jgi:hypothetical protein